jgi:spermidine/putrescine transport system permease protein
MAFGSIVPAAAPRDERRRSPGVIGWVLLAPMLLWLAVFVVAPTAILFVYSLSDRDEFGQVIFAFTLENYARVVDPLYVGILIRSLVYATATTVLCLLVGYPVAWFIARSPPRRRHLLLMGVMVPFWTSFLLRTYAWLSLLKAEGIVSATLQSARLLTGPLEILYTPTAVMIGLVYTYLPFMILPIYASAEKLDPAQVEAALDLGAGPWRAFREVIVPLTRPGIQAGILLVFVPAIGMFAVTDLMGGARVPLIGNVIQNQFGAARDWPFGSALGIAFLFLFVVTFWILHEREDEEGSR